LLQDLLKIQKMAMWITRGEVLFTLHFLIIGCRTKNVVQSALNRKLEFAKCLKTSFC